MDETDTSHDSTQLVFQSREAKPGDAELVHEWYCPLPHTGRNNQFLRALEGYFFSGQVMALHVSPYLFWREINTASHILYSFLFSRLEKEKLVIILLFLFFDWDPFAFQAFLYLARTTYHR